MKGHTVRLFTRTPATSIDADGDDWIVRTNRGPIKTWVDGPRPKR